jgi:endonuclease-3
MNDVAFSEVLKILEEKFPIQVWTLGYTPFEVLMATILSQATSRENSIQGFERLRDKFGITLEEIANANPEEIKECIKPAGLQSVKAPRMKEIARTILEKYEGDLNRILNLPLKEARAKLLEFPGVGEKTADVMLNFVAEKATFPVDTHIARIAKRLRLVKETANYAGIRDKFESLLKEDERERRTVHLLLIEFGRQICRAKNPRCDICPIERYCEWRIKE